MSSDGKVVPELVDALLALPVPEQQESFLRAAKLLDADGLDRLLDVADHLLGSDPGKARRLAELCAKLADSASAPAAVPRANYTRAGAHNINGEFDEDLRLTRAAHDGYLALGMNLEALRTNVGKMAALLELGRYQEALDTGQAVLDTLDGQGELEVSPTPEEANLLIALVQQNRGGCLEYMGRYEEALKAYAVAEELYQTLGMTERLSEILGNRGAVLLSLGRGREALKAYEAVAVASKRAGFVLSHAKALSNIGEVHLQFGDYARSLDALKRSRGLLDTLDALTEEFYVLRSTADAYLALNLYSEALATYREVDGLLQSAGMAHERARALWGMGSAMIARSEFDKAEGVLNEAANLFAAANNTPLLSGVMLEQASLLAAHGDRKIALAKARQALELVSEDDWPVQQVYARLRLADLLPDGAETESHLEEARRLIGRLALPQLRYRLNERLGRLRRLQGRDEEARTLLEAAVEEIEHLRGTVYQDSMRASFLRDKTAAFEDLLQLHLSQDDEENVHRAFAVAERAKSRALVDLLTGVAEAETSTSTDPELGGRLRVLHADLNAVYSEMLRGHDRAEHGRPLPDLEARAAELEGEIGRLRLHAAAADATHDPFSTSAVPPDTIRDRIPPDVTLLAYHAIGDEVMAFVGTRASTRAVRLPTTTTAVRRLLQKLTVQWDRFRAGREFARRHMALLERSARQVLAALHAGLVAPIETLLAEAAGPVSVGMDEVRKLTVVPHGPLHQVPFHALFDGQRYLVERFEMSYAPSATVYALCQEREPRDPGRALVFGVADPLIPAATTEARAVAGRFDEAEIRVGEAATVAALRSEAPWCGSLHLACHGLFRADNPMFSSLKLRDAWLTATDAMTLDLKGALVTLSACESGRNEVVGGDEILGLTRAFLGAGAATLVVSLWLVQDETTAELMGGWYERLRDGEGRTAALRAAQLELKERYPHPYYWAPFVLIGKR